MPPPKQSSIVIVGAGVFGLTTALHLSKAGYENIHIFDKQPYHLNAYSFAAGCDAASADENKILRASYGNNKLYQDLAFSAMKDWEAWNEDISKATDLPAGLSNEDKLWENCGFLRIGTKYDTHKASTQNNFPEDIKHTQYRITDSQRVQDATRAGIPKTKLDPFYREQRNLQTDGVLDTTAGFVLASKACTYCLHLCQKAGVKLHLGPSIGHFKSYLQSGLTIRGITTADNKIHPADLVVMACGGWTPSLVPQTNRILETTSGSVLTIRLPPSRHDLWDKYSPEKFPVWSWEMHGYDPDATESSIGGLYGFPRTKDGIIKFGFRGAKFTNYAFHTSDTETEGESATETEIDTEGGGDEGPRVISYPKTDVERVPERAMNVVKAFCRENLPDLLELELERGRLCWYTDSIDNSFLVDYVPGVQGLMVASGGSGHGFKFLPVLGRLVVGIVEGRGGEYSELFRWRDEGEVDGERNGRNGLEEGPEGWRTLDKQRLVGRGEWRL